MPFDNGLEAFGRSIVIEVRFNEIVHHRFESLITRLRIVHHPTKHMQDIRAFSVDQLRGSLCFVGIEPRTHPDWSGIVWPEAELILIENALALALPEFQVLVEFAALGGLQKETG